MDINYLAGFFDGEGCIIVQGKRWVSVRVTQLAEHREPLDELHKRYGGSIYDTGNKNRQCLRWIINGQNSIKFLKDMLPLCIVKKKHIKIALCMVYMVKIRKNKTIKIPEGEKWLTARLAEKIKELNKRVPM